MKKILIVEFGSHYKRPLLEKIMRLGYQLYIAATTYPKRLSEIIPKERFILTDTYNSVLLLADVSIFINSSNITFDGIGTFWEATVTQTADLAGALGLPNISGVGARRSSQNKLLMRIFCQRAHIKMPKFCSIHLDDPEFYQKVCSFGFPSVIKPLYGSSSQGVIMLNSEYDVITTIQKVKASTSLKTEEVFKNFSGQMLLEEYLPGRLISLDGLIYNGEVTFAGSVEFFMGKEPYFTQIGSIIPAQLSETDLKSAQEYVLTIIKALRFDNCGFHCELRISENGPLLIEIAARLPGGPLILGYEKAFGIDLIKGITDIWTNTRPSIHKTREHFSLHKCVFPKITNTVTLLGLTGTEGFSQNEYIWDYIQEKNIGDKIRTYPEIPDSVVYYALTHTNREEILSISSTLESKLTFLHD